MKSTIDILYGDHLSWYNQKFLKESAITTLELILKSLKTLPLEFMRDYLKLDVL